MAPRCDAEAGYIRRYNAAIRHLDVRAAFRALQAWDAHTDACRLCHRLEGEQ